MPSQLYMADYTSPLRAKAQGKRALGQAAGAVIDGAIAAYKDSAAREGHIERLIEEQKRNLLGGPEADEDRARYALTTKEHAQDWITSLEESIRKDGTMTPQEQEQYIKGAVQDRLIKAKRLAAKEGMSGLAGSPSAVSALPTSSRSSGDPILDGVDQLVANKAQQPPVDGEGESTTTTSLSSPGWGQQSAGAMGALPAQQTGPLAWDANTLRNESDPRLRSFGEKVDMYNKLGLGEDKSILKGLVDEKTEIDKEIAAENRQSQEKGEDRAFKAEQAKLDRDNRLSQAQIKARARPPKMQNTKYAQAVNAGLALASNIADKLTALEKTNKISKSLGNEEEIARLKNQYDIVMTKVEENEYYADQEAEAAGFKKPPKKDSKPFVGY